MSSSQKEILDRYEASYNIIEEQIKKIDAQKKELKAKQEPYKNQIYELMTKLELEETSTGHKKKKFAPKTKKKSKSKKEKQKDAIAFFSSITRKNPEEMYEKFLQTQKSPPQTDEKEKSKN